MSDKMPAIGTHCGWCGRGLPGGAPPLANRIAALEAELAYERARRKAAEKDAARYRWLRDNCRDSWYEAGAKEEPVQLIHYTPHENIHGWEERLDAAIDAARKEA